MNQEHTNSGPEGFISGLLIGGLLGAIAMLWLAPQSGKKTQQMIRKQAHQMQRSAEGALEDIRGSAEHASEDMREKVAEARHDSQAWLDQQADQVNKTASKIRNSVAR